MMNNCFFLSDPSLDPALPLGDSFSSDSGYGLIDAVEAIEAATDLSHLGDLDAINARGAHARGFTGEDTTIAIIDTGLDVEHEAFEGRLWTNPGEIPGNGIDDDNNGYVDDTHGANMTTNSGDLTDDHTHGTHVAGIASSVAPDARIMPVKVDSAAGLTSDNITEGIYYAVRNGADVINLSLGGGYNPDIEEAIRYAESQGCTVVMAAGNDGWDYPTFPAHIAEEIGIAVGAVDGEGSLAGFSNRAGDVVIDYVVAPGVDIRSSIPGNSYADLDGTSMAAPHVAGLAALIKSANPDLTPAEIEEIITRTANDSVTLSEPFTLTVES